MTGDTVMRKVKLALPMLPDEEIEAQREDVRLFAFFLDDYHVRRGNDMAVRKPLIDFIQNQLAPADMVAIMYPLTPVADITFTRNQSQMISAIENFEGRKFNYVPRNQFEEEIAYYPAATVERIRNQITMGALKAAAIRMGGLREGRKSIIFVSEGFTSSLPPQLADPVAAYPGMGNPNRGNAAATTDERAEQERLHPLVIRQEQIHVVVAQGEDVPVPFGVAFRPEARQGFQHLLNLIRARIGRTPAAVL